MMLARFSNSISHIALCFFATTDEESGKDRLAPELVPNFDLRQEFFTKKGREFHPHGPCDTS